jgi:hypothetical protein
MISNTFENNGERTIRSDMRILYNTFSMEKNLLRYYKAWKLRKQGKTLKEIGNIMGFSIERARTLIAYMRFILRRKNEDFVRLQKLLASNI